MKLKDRGITVGDLLLITVFVVLTFLIINKIKSTDNQSHNYKIPIEYTMS